MGWVSQSIGRGFLSTDCAFSWLESLCSQARSSDGAFRATWRIGPAKEGGDI